METLSPEEPPTISSAFGWSAQLLLLSTCRTWSPSHTQHCATHTVIPGGGGGNEQRATGSESHLQLPKAHASPSTDCSAYHARVIFLSSTNYAGSTFTLLHKDFLLGRGDGVAIVPCFLKCVSPTYENTPEGINGEWPRLITNPHCTSTIHTRTVSGPRIHWEGCKVLNDSEEVSEGFIYPLHL